MKVLCISDITIEIINRNAHYLIQEKGLEFEFIYSDNIVSELLNFRQTRLYKCIYIHIDSFFKRYETDYLSSLIEIISDLTVKAEIPIFCSNLMMNPSRIYALNKSVGLIHDNILENTTSWSNLRNARNLFFVDVASILFEIGYKEAYNFKLGHLYQMPYTKCFLDRFSNLLIETITRIFTPDKKVIVLDCDNTLWKGVVGEDGIDGIKCDLNSEGILYYHFQQFLKTKKNQGFILTLCSKNNEKDVEEAFEKKYMPLKWKDFVIKKVNWTDKQQNLREIAEELNLGLESLIFIDDSEFEINSVRTILPEINSIKMQKDYGSLFSIITDLSLDKKIITKDDLSKTEQYIQETQRKKEKRKSKSFEEYIKSLKTTLIIKENPLDSLPRISQLTEKTNQFNFNKRYYSIENLSEQVSKGTMTIFSLEVSDKFGDYGLVGVILVKVENGSPILENFIMSCRALGRRIEYDFFKEVENRVIKAFKKNYSEIRFTKTPKNIPAKKFYTEISKSYEF